jgi:hypothetical protein
MTNATSSSEPTVVAPVVAEAAALAAIDDGYPDGRSPQPRRMGEFDKLQLGSFLVAPADHPVEDLLCPAATGPRARVPRSPASSHLAGELVHVEIVPPGVDLAVADLEGSHDRQLECLAAELEDVHPLRHHDRTVGCDVDDA